MTTISFHFNRGNCGYDSRLSVALALPTNTKGVRAAERYANATTDCYARNSQHWCSKLALNRSSKFFGYYFLCILYYGLNQILAGRNVVNKGHRDATRPHRVFRVPSLLERLPVILSTDQMAEGHEITRLLFLDFLHLLGNTVLVHPFRIAHRTHHQGSGLFIALDESLLDVVMDRCLLSGHEPGSHVETLGTESQGSSELRAVRASAGGNKGNLELALCLSEQYPVSYVVLPGMASALESIHRDHVSPKPLGCEGVLDGHALVDDVAAILLEEPYEFLWVATGCFNDFHSLLDDDFCIRFVVRRNKSRQEGDIHAEWLVRQRAALADLLSKGLGVRLG
mmetsp:Transcript_22189/g.44509  ORF Transcript_22189/g.44509 Transcript_22189/m.44509 type:complete len:339 (-) Transcript_22189:176-1192(-)